MSLSYYARCEWSSRILLFPPAKILSRLCYQGHCFGIYRQVFLTFIVSETFKLTRFSFEVRQKFEAVPRK